MDVTFEIDMRFRIVETKNKYLVECKQLYKKSLKGIDKNIVENIISKFPMNIKDISNLNLDIGFTINRGLFRVDYEDEEYSIFFIRILE